MLIISIPEDGPGETIYQSWWRFPGIKGIKKGTPEYEALQRMWEDRTGKKIPKEEDDVLRNESAFHTSDNTTR